MARATAEARRMTYEEYERSVPPGTHSEWVDGEVTIFMTQSFRHSEIVMWLGALVRLFIELRGLGNVCIAPFEMTLRDGRAYREPDLLVVTSEHLDRLERKRLRGPADLVIEVLSDDDPRRDRIEKYEEYESEGVLEYWIVEGRERRSGTWVYVLGADGKYHEEAPDEEGRLHSTVLPGFWLDPAWLAADPLPKVLDCFRAIAPDAFGPPPTNASSPNGS